MLNALLLNITLIVRIIAISYLLIWLLVEYKAGKKMRIAFAVFTLFIGYLCVLSSHLGREHQYNAVYNAASSRLVRTTLNELEKGRTTEVVDTLRWLDHEFKPTWADHDNYDDLVDQATARMKGAAATPMESSDAEGS